MNATNPQRRCGRARALGLALALAASAAPAVAQEGDHAHRHAPAPQSDDKAKTDAPAVEPAVDAHAGHTMPAPAAPPVDHAAMSHATQPSSPPVDHAAMGHDGSATTTQPIEPIPPLTEADRLAAFPQVADHVAHGTSVQSFWLLDRMEAWNADEGTGVGWEAVSWIGTDIDRLWLRSEGERVDGDTESADIEVLYGRAFSRWWDAVAGVRHDFGEGPSQTFAAVGVQGLAPGWFEVEATAYVGQSGQTAARFEVEHDTLLSNRLILQWLAEAELHGKDDPRRGIGSGLGSVEAGLRLRYEFSRRFAPYVGVAWERVYGRTADYRREHGEDIDDTRLVAGVRIWF